MAEESSGSFFLIIITIVIIIIVSSSFFYYKKKESLYREKISPRNTAVIPVLPPTPTSTPTPTPLTDSTTSTSTPTSTPTMTPSDNQYNDRIQLSGICLDPESYLSSNYTWNVINRSRDNFDEYNKDNSITVSCRDGRDTANVELCENEDNPFILSGCEDQCTEPLSLDNSKFNYTLKTITSKNFDSSFNVTIPCQTGYKTSTGSDNAIVEMCDAPNQPFRISGCDICDDGYEMDPETNLCVESVCQCNNGFPARGPECGGQDEEVCVSCFNGYNLSFVNQNYVSGNIRDPARCDFDSAVPPPLTHCQRYYQIMENNNSHLSYENILSFRGSGSDDDINKTIGPGPEQCNLHTESNTSCQPGWEHSEGSCDVINIDETPGADCSIDFSGLTGTESEINLQKQNLCNAESGCFWNKYCNVKGSCDIDDPRIGNHGNPTLNEMYLSCYGGDDLHANAESGRGLLVRGSEFNEGCECNCIDSHYLFDNKCKVKTCVIRQDNKPEVYNLLQALSDSHSGNIIKIDIPGPAQDGGYRMDYDDSFGFSCAQGYKINPIYSSLFNQDATSYSNGFTENLFTCKGSDQVDTSQGETDTDIDNITGKILGDIDISTNELCVKCEYTPGDPTSGIEGCVDYIWGENNPLCLAPGTTSAPPETKCKQCSHSTDGVDGDAQTGFSRCITKCPIGTHFLSGTIQFGGYPSPAQTDEEGENLCVPNDCSCHSDQGYHTYNALLTPTELSHLSDAEGQNGGGFQDLLENSSHGSGIDNVLKLFPKESLIDFYTPLDPSSSTEQCHSDCLTQTCSQIAGGDPFNLNNLNSGYTKFTEILNKCSKCPIQDESGTQYKCNRFKDEYPYPFVRKNDDNRDIDLNGPNGIGQTSHIWNEINNNPDIKSYIENKLGLAPGTLCEQTKTCDDVGNEGTREKYMDEYLKIFACPYEYDDNHNDRYHHLLLSSGTEGSGTSEAPFKTYCDICKSGFELYRENSVDGDEMENQFCRSINCGGDRTKTHVIGSGDEGGNNCFNKPCGHKGTCAGVDGIEYTESVYEHECGKCVPVRRIRADTQQGDGAISYREETDTAADPVSDYNGVPLTQENCHYTSDGSQTHEKVAWVPGTWLDTVIDHEKIIEHCATYVQKGENGCFGDDPVCRNCEPGYRTNTDGSQCIKNNCSCPGTSRGQTGFFDQNLPQHQSNCLTNNRSICINNNQLLTSGECGSGSTIRVIGDQQVCCNRAEQASINPQSGKAECVSLQCYCENNPNGVTGVAANESNGCNIEVIENPRFPNRGTRIVDGITSHHVCSSCGGGAYLGKDNICYPFINAENNVCGDWTANDHEGRRIQGVVSNIDTYTKNRNFGEPYDDTEKNKQCGTDANGIKLKCYKAWSSSLYGDNIDTSSNPIDENNILSFCFRDLYQPCTHDSDCGGWHYADQQRHCHKCERGTFYDYTGGVNPDGCTLDWNNTCRQGSQTR